MHKVYIQMNLLYEKYFIQQCCPPIWTQFISNALVFESKEDAITSLNTNYLKILESLDNNEVAMNNITIITINDGKIIDEEKYIGRCSN